MPAKKSAAKKNLKPGTHEYLRANGYEECDVCGRLMKDIGAHKTAHKKHLIGDDGKRTDRKPVEALVLARRFNGRPATKRWKGLSPDQRAKAKVKA